MNNMIELKTLPKRISDNDLQRQIEDLIQQHDYLSLGQIIGILQIIQYNLLQNT
jgi:hypothetical protein